MALIGRGVWVGIYVGRCWERRRWCSRRMSAPVPGRDMQAAVLSGIALLLAIFPIAESLRPGSKAAGHALIDWASVHDAFDTPSVPALLATAFASVVSFAAFETTLFAAAQRREPGV